MRLLGLGQEELQISVVCSQNEQDSYTMQDCNMSSIWGFLWRRQRHPTPVLLPGKSHGWRSLVGCSPWGHEESDTTEQLHFHFSLLCIGEGNGNPLQCSCLENPRDSRAWWVANYGVRVRVGQDWSDLAAAAAAQEQREAIEQFSAGQWQNEICILNRSLWLYCWEEIGAEQERLQEHY